MFRATIYIIRMLSGSTNSVWIWSLVELTLIPHINQAVRHDLLLKNLTDAPHQSVGIVGHALLALLY